MLPVGLFLVGIIMTLVVVEYFNDKRKEAKGICKTTGGTCTSSIGCTCGEIAEERESY